MNKYWDSDVYLNLEIELAYVCSQLARIPTEYEKFDCVLRQNPSYASEQANICELIN
jgi:hypothetical protein